MFRTFCTADNKTCAFDTCDVTGLEISDHDDGTPEGIIVYATKNFLEEESFLLSIKYHTIEDICEVINKDKYPDS